jgi:hypothetical protein
MAGKKERRDTNKNRTKELWSVKVWTSDSFQRVMDSVHNPTTALLQELLQWLLLRTQYDDPSYIAAWSGHRHSEKYAI